MNGTWQYVNLSLCPKLLDHCICPIKGHDKCKIAEGDAKVLIDGVPVAFEGHKTTCGATLISTVSTTGRG